MIVINRWGSDPVNRYPNSVRVGGNNAAYAIRRIPVVSQNYCVKIL